MNFKLMNIYLKLMHKVLTLNTEGLDCMTDLESFLLFSQRVREKCYKQM